MVPVIEVLAMSPYNISRSLARSYISFSVNRLCPCMSSSTTNHWVAIKRIIRYLHETIEMRLSLHKSGSFFAECISDADWADNPDDRRSTSDYAIFFGAIFFFGVPISNSLFFFLL